MDVSVKFGDSSSNGSRDSEAVGCGIFDRILNYDNCQPEVVSDVISGIVDHDVSTDACANFGNSRSKPSEVSFRPFFERR